MSMKNPVTSSAIEPATFRLEAQCLDQLLYHVPPFLQNLLYKIYPTSKQPGTVQAAA
jgi:hypothetical protein